MKIKVVGNTLNGKVKAIPSKSYAHRILICNFLSGKKPCVNVGDFSSADIEATKNCLLALQSNKNLLDCGESGSTLRFLLPLCAALGGGFEFVGHGKLMERPNEQLFSVLTEHGVKVDKGDTIKIEGKLVSGEYRIRGDISSQYVSGLLLALPYMEGDSKIILTTPLASKPYVDITLEVLKGFGVSIEQTDYGFYIKGDQKYNGDICPEGDWSNAAFFLAMGAVCGEVTVQNLKIDSVQGDKKILDILLHAGAVVSVGKDFVTVKKGELNGFTFDADDCPDLVPVSAVVGAFSKGVTTIKNVQRLKIKESDRIKSTIEMLNSFGIKAKCDGANLYVYGGVPVCAKVNSFNDHRIVMSATVMASGVTGESVIEGAQAVDKSYPTFFADYLMIGGKAYES